MTSGPGTMLQAYAALCGIAGQDDPKAIAAAVAALEGPDNGSWAISWGPAYHLIDSNLAYAAAYTPSGGGQPTEAVVVIRGTDTNVNPVAVIKEISQDLGVLTQTNLPWGGTTGAKIGKGALDAFNAVLSAASLGDHLLETIEEYVEKALATSGLSVVIAGHSLGGCITTVMASYLPQALGVAPGALRAVTFAAPTAGNQAFIDYYYTQAPGAIGFQSSLDIVPDSWASTKAINTIYQANGVPTPNDVIGYLDVIRGFLTGEGFSFAQQSGSDFHELTGTWITPTGTDLFSSEAGAQHQTANYITLMAANGF